MDLEVVQLRNNAPFTLTATQHLQQRPHRLKVSHYYLSVNALAEPMEVREKQETYGESET